MPRPGLKAGFGGRLCESKTILADVKCKEKLNESYVPKYEIIVNKGFFIFLILYEEKRKKYRNIKKKNNPNI